MEQKLLLASGLTVALWELLKLAFRSSIAITYYKRESDKVVLRIKVMPWDYTGKKHFEDQGYSREFPRG